MMQCCGEARGGIMQETKWPMYDVVGCLTGILNSLKEEQELDELDGGEVGGSSGAGVDDHNGGFWRRHES